MNIKIHNPNKLPTIDYREVEEFQGNLKDLTKDNYAKLKKSIEENGFFVPIFLWKCNGKFKVLDAHQRLRVLKKEQVTPYLIPYLEIEAKDTKEAKKKLLLISSQYGTITQEGLDEFAFDLDTDWMADTLNFDNVFDFDKIDVEEDDYGVPDKIETDIKLGDLFQLDSHRLLCGDATKKEDVERLMGGQKADMIFTDPPYGVNYGVDQELIQKKSGGKLSRSRSRSSIINDDKSANELAKILWRPSFKNYYENAKDDCSFYMTMCQGGDQMMMMMMMMMSEHWQIKHELIWVKNSPVFSMGRLNYDYQHEPILFGWKKRHNWYGKGQFKKSIWEIPKPQKSELHPTMKPIKLIENALLNSSLKEQIIVDLFGGSGSTLIACEQLDRRCYMSEISPEYCQIIIDRWETLTEQKAKKIN